MTLHGGISLYPTHIECERDADDGSTWMHVYEGDKRLVLSMNLAPLSNHAKNIVAAIERAVENPIAHMEFVDGIIAAECAELEETRVCDDCGCGHHEVTR